MNIQSEAPPSISCVGGVTACWRMKSLQAHKKRAMGSGPSVARWI